MNNKLDTFNKDKFKCEKCKNYYDLPFSLAAGPPDWIFKKRLCYDCYAKWFFPTKDIDDWCNDEQ